MVRMAGDGFVVRGERSTGVRGIDEPVTRPRWDGVPGLVTRAVSWAVPAVGAAWSLQGSSGAASQVSSSVVVVVVGVLFLLLIVRVVVTAARRGHRGASLWALAVGLVLWAAGSAVLNSAEATESVSFPAPGEWLFLSAYVGFTAFLVLDRVGATAAAGSGWLDGVIVVGGTACVALVAVLTPFAGDHGNTLGLLVALMYPLLDVALLLIVVAQVVMRHRPLGLRAVGMISGFVALAVADTSLVASARSGSYEYGLVVDLTWCLGFLLLVDAACARPAQVAPDGASMSRLGTVPITIAAAAALVNLLPLQASGIRLVVVVPALVTLLAAGLRLGLALRQAQQVVEALQLARTDDLTGLPNRRALHDRLNGRTADGLTDRPHARAVRLRGGPRGLWPDRARGAAKGRARPGTSGIGLLLLDLDGFKEINDTLGHFAGDAVLRSIAHRIRAAAEPDMLVVRLGGDEFAVAVGDDDTSRLLELALRLRDAIRKPVRVDGLEVSLDVSIGIAASAVDGPAGAAACAEGTGGSDADTADETAPQTQDGPVGLVAGAAADAAGGGSGGLLRRADVAMYQAKTGRLGVLVYDPARDDFSRERLRVAEDLRRGIDQGEVVAWYQPKVDATTGCVTGVEALVRWAHPTDGLLQPAVFLPAARRTGLMPALTSAVLTQVIADMVDWRRAGLHVHAAVNVAPAELLAPGVMSELLGMVQTADLPAGSLIIEVTEDSFLADPERARDVIAEIGRHGLEVAIDDFGTGFSSLGYLRDLPVQELKIDRSFVCDILTNPRNEMIVRTTLQLGRGLGLRTVAEGVEDAEIAHRLRLLGVDELQGYHFARPMPPAAIPGWIAEHSPVEVAVTG